MLNTAEIAVASTAGCVILGLTLGLILAFAPFPGAGLVARVIDTFIALPTFLVTLAFTFLYGSAGILNGALTSGLALDHPPVDFLYSAWGVILAEVTVYTPFVLRPLLAAFSLVDRSQIEVASLLGARPLRIVRQVILPAALPAIVAGGSLCLLLTVNEFGIVLFIGAKGVITLPLLDLRQGDPGIGLSGRLRDRDRQRRAVARPVRPLPIRRAPVGRLGRCSSGRCRAASSSGASPR